ncbi:hypothetical protein KAH39_03955 [Alcaligenes faecalis]|uniref:aminotransferase n=1 Tax=Alcaligenes faecalis TaxID=511 RepID=UPI000F6863D3|nr:aminotransferase [Alcaligenes faecalis]MBQ0216458.1 hypothetical protein [Alcaligenes faecalis]RSE62666.1 aminotransferase [Alcaligenes faecalis]
MHTCPPPIDALNQWLDSNGTVEGKYGHLLLEQKSSTGKSLVDALRPYFESAHLDARRHFHEQIGISLHPDCVGQTVEIQYPECLPITARRGLFGEVLAGLITEGYKHEFVGAYDWKVPVFLFREHEDAEQYLWTLRFDPGQVREIFGRHGSDFIGITLNPENEVARVIVGEAKWRKTLTQSVVDALLNGPKKKTAKTDTSAHNGRGIWYELNRDAPIPHGLRQLQRILEANDPSGYSSTIASIDRAVFGKGPRLARTNLVLIVGNGSSKREELTCLVPHDAPPPGYTASPDLQVAEVVLKDGESLIDALYTSLWQDL